MCQDLSEKLQFTINPERLFVVFKKEFTIICHYLVCIGFRETPAIKTKKIPIKHPQSQQSIFPSSASVWLFNPSPAPAGKFHISRGTS